MSTATNSGENYDSHASSSNQDDRSTNTSPQSQAVETPENHSEEDVTQMVKDLSNALESAIEEIESVNSETKVLALNARIEAARAGSVGAAFGVVAQEMQTLSAKTSTIARDMSHRTREKTANLMSLIDVTIRGTRLSDLALVNIDLIDRNLYERTCDVRWWATDASLVDALTDPNADRCNFASKRLGVILDAYTVYHDLVLCDQTGMVVANGRPREFASVGKSESHAEWFTEAAASRSGDEYGFQSAHVSQLCNNQPSLIYSCGVRRDGNANGDLLGVLGILFNWTGLAEPILTQMPIHPSDQAKTKAYICDQQGRILASNQNDAINSKLSLPEFDKVVSSEKGFYVAEYGKETMCIGHASSPGFETYKTGWVSIVMQPIED
ncbi:Methyl-accepting chemotaxis protein 4 [Rubripirellula obstinata]|uniref:Methyl-accepting chemotaxis protein 4 n=1 Tax=Rubripirellula obstinata TaxID=406547 RepID=A0A5B1CH48_9BACT|nr:methyl-accepting chemotaxis protein [Rubripirellula obstinata]KAA1258534.1 Methyl-accepting chemotaxis protein 4 [Rubripirellula obstinata]